MLIGAYINQYLIYCRKDGGKLGFVGRGICKSVSVEGRVLVCAGCSELAPVKYYERRRRV